MLDSSELLEPPISSCSQRKISNYMCVSKIGKQLHSNKCLAYILIGTSNHMFGRAIWDKLPECILENCSN